MTFSAKALRRNDASNIFTAKKGLRLRQLPDPFGFMNVNFQTGNPQMFEKQEGESTETKYA